MTLSLRAARYESVLVVGNTAMPVQRFECTYKINEAPVAVIVVPTGRALTAAGLGAPSPAYSAPAVTDATIPARLYLNGRLVLSGYVSSAGFQHAVISNEPVAGVTITVRHWLGTLDFATLINPTTHAISPVHFILGVQATMPAAVAEAPRVAQINLRSSLFQRAPNIADDVWKNLRPWLNHILDYFNIFPQQRRRSDPLLPRRVLNSILSPLPLKLHGAKESLLTIDRLYDSILEGFLATYSKPLASGASLWDRLLSFFIPAFALVLIPFPDRAIIVPDTPTTYPQYMLRADQQSLINFSSGFFEPIGTVALFSPAAQMVFGPQATIPTCIGFFPTGRPGKQIFLPAPPMLANLPAFSLIMFSKDMGKVWTSAMRRSSAYKTAVDRVLEHIVKLMEGTLSLGNRYAAVAFDQMFFATRQATVGGPIDVIYAPGTPLYVQPHYKAWPWLCRVQQTKIQFDAEQQMALVTYNVQHCRSMQEHAMYGFNESPLYKTAWKGASLFALVDEEKEKKRMAPAPPPPPLPDVGAQVPEPVNQ